MKRTIPTAATHRALKKKQPIQIHSPPVVDIKNGQAGSSKLEERIFQQQETTTKMTTEEETSSSSSQHLASPKELTYTGNATIPITSHLHIVKPGEDAPQGIWPVFRIMVSQI
jgi:hypothetical protein